MQLGLGRPLTGTGTGYVRHGNVSDSFCDLRSGQSCSRAWVPSWVWAVGDTDLQEAGVQCTPKHMPRVFLLSALNKMHVSSVCVCV